MSASGSQVGTAGALVGSSSNTAVTMMSVLGGTLDGSDARTCWPEVDPYLSGTRDLAVFDAKKARLGGLDTLQRRDRL